MNIVLDTNVLIAAFIARQGVCSAVLEWCVRHHQLVTSEKVLSEFSEILARKFHYGIEEALQVAALLRSNMRIVKPTDLVSVCRDPDDNVIISTALAGDADLIITGDADLFTLKHYENVRILTPREFLDLDTPHAGQ